MFKKCSALQDEEILHAYLIEHSLQPFDFNCEHILQNFLDLLCVFADINPHVGPGDRTEGIEDFLGQDVAHFLEEPVKGRPLPLVALQERGQHRDQELLQTTVTVVTETNNESMK